MIRALLLLLRPKLSLLNGVAAVSGCLLIPGALEGKVLFASFSGVALLTAGGSALNQALEKDLDSMMLRTRLRPLPQGQLTLSAAVAIGVTIILTGFLLILSVGGLLPAMFGIAALIWYLAVYTPLKLRTPFALAIGGICGALPPIIGWTLAGGSPTDFRIILLAGLLYLWQVPHFWLLIRRHEDDYRLAGIELPGTSQRWVALMGIWITALVTATILLPALGVLENQVVLWYALFPLSLIVMAIMRAEKLLFSCYNLFPLLLTGMLGVQKYL